MANDGHEKSPLSDSLAADESGLGIENLNDRLLRYAGGKNPTPRPGRTGAAGR